MSNIDRLFNYIYLLKSNNNVSKEFIRLFKEISLDEQRDFFNLLNDNDIPFFYYNLYYLVKEYINLDYCSSKFILYSLSKDVFIDLSKLSNKFIMENINSILDIIEDRPKDNFLMDNIIDILVNNNYIVSNNTHSLLLSNYKFISKVIDSGQIDAINYANREIVDDVLIIKSHFRYRNDYKKVMNLKSKIEKSLVNGKLVESLENIGYDLISLALLSKLSYQRISYLNSNLINNIMNYDTVYRALSYRIYDSLDEYYKYLKDNNLNIDIDDKLINFALDNGYEISTTSPDIIISNYDYIKRIIEQGNFNALTMFYIYISNNPGKVTNGIDEELVLSALSNGYFVYNDMTAKIIIGYCPDKILDVVKDKNNFLSYLDDDMINVLKDINGQDYIKLFFDSIDNFKYVYLPLNIIASYYEYFISRNLIDVIINNIDDNFIKQYSDIIDKIIDEILMGNVTFNSLTNTILLREAIFKSYYSYFEHIDEHEVENYIDNLIYLYKNRNLHVYHNDSKFDINKFKVLLYDEEITNKTNGLINVEELLFYTFSDRLEIDILNTIIDKGELNSLLNQYVYIINNFYSGCKKIERYNIFIKCIFNFSLNSKFIEEILNTHRMNISGYEEGFVSHAECDDIDNLVILLLESNDYNLIKNFDSKEFSYIKYLDYIFNNCDINNIDNLKNFIIMNLFNITVGKYNYIIKNKLTFKTLNVIIETTNDMNLKEKAEEFLILFSMIDEILSMNDLNSLQELYSIIKEEMYSKDRNILNIRALTRTLESDINELYAYEANNNLVDISKYPKVINNGVEYIDLSNKKYTLYAHVYEGDNVLDMFQTKNKGRFAICVSPITNLNNNTYSEGIIFGFSKIPIKSYIGSSIENMGSNFFIDENSINFNKDILKYHCLTIRDSANYSKNFAETLLIREDLVPSCLIAKELPIDSKIINVQNELKRNGIDLPIVYIGNSINKVDSEDIDDIEFEYQGSKDDLLELKERLLNISKDKKVHYIEEEKILKSSHNIYTGMYNGGNYLIKPGINKKGNIEPYRALASLVGANIQSLVYSIASKYDSENINVNGAIPVLVEEIDGNDINMSGSNITCALCKIIHDTINLEKINDIHNKKIVTGLMIEFIVDHLIFNYDSKIDNFIIDSYFNVYGIDKEQAFKYYKECLNDTGFLVDERFFDTSLVYNDILNDLDDDIINLLRNIVYEISSINDNQYIELFRPYIDSYCSIYPEEREILSSAIISRKNNLVLDLDEFINSRVVKVI